MSKLRLAFYGTLKRDGETPLHQALAEHLHYVGPCKIPGQLYDLGRMPALKDGDGVVYGELYEVDNPHLVPLIDGYEATEQVADNPVLLPPGFYRRRVQLLEPAGEADVYYYDGPIEHAQLITDGRWRP